MLELAFVSRLYESPEVPGEAISVALSILLVSLYVYALWPARREDDVEFRVVTPPREGHSEQGTVGIGEGNVPGVKADHHSGQGQPPQA